MIMIDGVSASHFRRRRADLPNLDALAAGGLVVERVAPEVPATSLPGRASIATGLPAREHGIYGNRIFDGQEFRYANPDDVRVPTLPRVARDAGLVSAVVGYGMIRPEDATIFKGPWWANEMLQRARDERPIAADESWLRTTRVHDSSETWQRLAAAGYPSEVPDAYSGDAQHYLLAGLAGDRTMMQWSAALATGGAPPDLLMTEILIPDSVQHLAGQDHAFSDWAIGYADDLVGTLMAELERSGRLAETTILVTSDHGHGAVERALYSDNLLPGRPVACEGSVLLAATDGEKDAVQLERELAPHGVERLSADYLPPDLLGQIALFVAPDGCSFQPNPAAAGDAAVSGPPSYSSSHGFRPGREADERFLIVKGPGIETRSLQLAAAEDVAATAAGIIGLRPLGNGRCLV